MESFQELATPSPTLNYLKEKCVELSLTIDPKKLNREKRIHLAKKLFADLKTKKKIKAYRNFFGVDKCCAAKELTATGIELQEKYAHRWATRHERKAKAKKKKLISRSEKGSANTSRLFESDYYHYQIMGYTSAGFSYGITWEEAEANGLIEDENLNCF